MMYRTVEHFLERAILRSLSRNVALRFRDLQPRGIENGVFAYHLKQLVEDGLVMRQADGLYRLTPSGNRYVGWVSRTNLDIHPQPKLFSLLIIKNDADEYVLHRRSAQPFIGRYTFPGGALFFDEELSEHTARQLHEKIGFVLPLTHRGMASLRIEENGQVLSHTYAQLFYAEVNGRPQLHAKDDRFRPQWHPLDTLVPHELMPDVMAMTEKLALGVDFFFLELKRSV